MKDFDLKKYLAENKLLKEEVDVNKILSDGGYDIIDDEELLMTVKNHPEFNSNIDAEKLNFLVMKIEDEEGGNIDFSEGKILKEKLTWFIDDENSDVRYENDAYLKEVGDKIKELHPDISDEDLNKIIIMTGDQYSREEDFHGDSIPSNHFVEAAVEIYQTDVMTDDQYNAWQASLAENKM